jgi:hypothetical protein
MIFPICAISDFMDWVSSEGELPTLSMPAFTVVLEPLGAPERPPPLGVGDQ